MVAGNKAAQERAARRQAEIEQRKRDERAARREAQRAASLAGRAAARDRPTAESPRHSAVTLGEVVARQDLVTKISAITRKLIAETVVQADGFGRTTLKVLPSCHTCSAAKGCCKITVAVYLYEAVPIAARLLREGRDTPELRRELAAAADAMESAGRDVYQRPCVFLDAAERCTVYEDRPSQCGTDLIFSDPTICSSSDPNARVQKFPAPLQTAIPPALEQRFLADVGLRRTDHVYIGALPRMILLCLEAWNRPDYVDFLAERGRAAAHKLGGAIGSTR